MPSGFSSARATRNSTRPACAAPRLACGRCAFAHAAAPPHRHLINRCHCDHGPMAGRPASPVVGVLPREAVLMMSRSTTSSTQTAGTRPPFRAAGSGTGSCGYFEVLLLSRLLIPLSGSCRLMGTMGRWALLHTCRLPLAVPKR